MQLEECAKTTREFCRRQEPSNLSQLVEMENVAALESRIHALPSIED